MADPNFANVSFLSGFEGGSIVDESSNAHTVTVAGTGFAQTVAQFKFGLKSVERANNTGNGAATVPNHASFTFGAGNFTVEFHVRFSSVAATGDNFLLSKMDYDTGTGQEWAISVNHGTGQLTLEVQEQANGAGDSNYITGTFAPVVDTWYHVAVDFDGVTYRIYVDGAVVGTSTYIMSGPMQGGDAALCIGSYLSTGAPVNSGFLGFLDEVRITKGVARYTGAFTAPSVPYSRTAGLDETLTDGIGFQDESDDVARHLQLVSVTTGMGSSANGVRGLRLTDALGVSAWLSPIAGAAVTVSEALGTSASVGALSGVVLTDILGLGYALSPAHLFNRTLTDTVNAVERLLPGIPVALAETLGLVSTEIAQQVIVITEALGVRRTIAPSFVYTRTWSDGLQLADSLANFFHGELAEGVGVADSIAERMKFTLTSAEGVGIAESFNNQLVLRATFTDELGIDEDALPQMIFTGTVAEGIEVAAAYISPGGGVTTWAMNTRTSAVTEYQNYAFNSFARHGHQTYLGASSTGLYELVGEDDAGTDIVSTIRSGFAQWSGTHLGSFKAAYLAVRGAGDYVLKVILPDDTTTTYTVTAESMKTVKVNMGKGLRARYFAFELVTAGQDFDLESLEFIPLVVQRRV